MAGDWIKMRVDLRDDPAVFAMSDALDISELHVIGSLFCFWAWADKHAVDGRVDGASPRLVDKVSMTPGFADAMTQVGWLQFDERGLVIPNFERHNGESAKERNLKNARQARWRAKKDAHVDATPSTETSTDPSTREEKRREEKKEREIQVRAAALTPPVGVSDSVWNDFLKIRRAKKAPMTAAALDGIRREAEKAGWSLEEVLTECCVRGWQGFKAEWVADKPKTFAQVAADVVRTTVPGKPDRDPTLVKIEEEAKRATPIPANIREKLALLKGANYA